MERLDLRKLGPEAEAELRLAGGLAAERGLRVFLVGGAVRDLLLGRPSLDIDVVVEGDGIAFARVWAGRTGAALRTHPRFGTAVLERPDGTRFDVVTARREAYSRPGALPEVHPGTLTEDLYRRDFTINAMAVSILPSNCGELHDELGGLGDLRRGVVKVIHANSFVDDPTRILRAIRYEQRFSFHLSEPTREALKEALQEDSFASIAPVRYWNEFRRILEEEDPLPALKRLYELGGWWPKGWPPTASRFHAVEQAAVLLTRYREPLLRRGSILWRVHLAALLVGLAAREATGVMTHLGVGRGDKRKIAEILQFVAVPVMLDATLGSSVLKKASPEALVLAAAIADGDSWLPVLEREMISRG
ncbi:MAG: CCA tRNA nucleotidyltransferase [Candidatus Omnitrophica bacterium]|nr:CCA tRNA nucleotidyltransferase [Candidatus Omnitrophota bacterium]